MKNLVLAATLAAAVTVPAFAAPVTYIVDPDHTFPRLSYQHLGFSKQILRFNKTSGQVTLDKVDKSAMVDITIDMASIDTGIAAFDEHMNSAEIFDTARFPTATFRSTNVVYDGERPARIAGELTIKGITRPLTLLITSYTSKLHPRDKKPAIGANASGVIRRSQFNAGYGVPAVSDEVYLDIALEALQK